MKKLLQFSAFILAGAGLFLFINAKNHINISEGLSTVLGQLTASTTQSAPVKKAVDPNADIPAQAPLQNPPAIIKAIYATGWSGGNAKSVDYFINLIKGTELNALVVDVKDYSGTVSYNMDVGLIKKYGAVEVKIPKINSLIKKLHDQGIYAIARIAVFQDPILAKARPDLALQSVSKGTTWKDNKGLAWMDPSSQEVWDYNIAVAKDVLSRGFDEVNFDYIRFASDGNMSDIKYPVWDAKTSKSKVIGGFAKYLRESLPGAKISADVFGLVTINYDDLGIGQKLEELLPYFDYVAPMVYPSHYASGFNGYKNPALYPYEVVRTSIAEAVKRIKIFSSATSTIQASLNVARLRPWLQDFNLGATYDASMVRAQINAVDIVAGSTTPMGWMLWNPSNVYTKAALNNE